MSTELCTYFDIPDEEKADSCGRDAPPTFVTLPALGQAPRDGVRTSPRIDFWHSVANRVRDVEQACRRFAGIANSGKAYMLTWSLIGPAINIIHRLGSRLRRPPPRRPVE